MTIGIILSVRPSSYNVEQFFAKFNIEEFPSPAPKILIVKLIREISHIFQ